LSAILVYGEWRAIGALKSKKKKNYYRYNIIYASGGDRYYALFINRVLKCQEIYIFDIFHEIFHFYEK